MRSKTIHLLMMTLMLAAPAWGQTSGNPYESYKQLLVMRGDTSVTKEVFYASAMNCANEFRSILLSLPSSVPDYSKTQETVKNLYPFIRSGAGYYSQQHQDSIAMIFARAAVDLAMMKEMENQGLRSTPDYPSFVYFVASRSFNAENYEDAVKYLREYINVADISKHPRALPFLEQAENIVAQRRKTSGEYVDVYKDAPDFDRFARKSLQLSMDKWKQKDPYETVSEYKERVNEETAAAKQKELQQILMDEYVQRFAYKFKVSDLQLKPYDADNQSFLIGSPYGDFVLKVPRTDNEARDFAENWSALKVYNHDFAISDRKLALAGLTFATPAGKIYNYDNHQALAYNLVVINANFGNDIVVNDDMLENSDTIAQKTVIKEQEIVVGVPDVDINIPEYKRVNDNTFAVIIANENYTLVPKVPMAGNDGRVFAEYCEKTLGLPKENILQYPDATYGKMIRALEDIKNIANAYDKIRVIFYYAGHGLPDEATKDAFLLPIDADGSHTKVCYPLKQLYSDLGALNAYSVIVFLDACFSGMTGDDKALAAASRGVAIKASPAEPKGNVVVFSAASGDETAYPYKDHGHGLFTYFLLKKLQDSKGSANLGELSAFVIENVQKKSAVINKKSQTPTISYPIELQATWQKLKLR